MTLRLIPMATSLFAPYVSRLIQEYAVEKQRAGTWLPDQALAYSENEFRRLLPQGQSTPNHYFFSFVDQSGQPIGVIWLHYSQADRSRQAFIYDFEIFEPFQGQGYGQKALQTVFAYCQQSGLAKLSLHVFAHNTRARHIYQKLGFIETDINMTKYLNGYV
ncbi:MAG: GNAT family N-acetyltransferase [Sporolactobacillus sp.]